MSFASSNQTQADSVKSAEDKSLTSMFLLGAYEQGQGVDADSGQSLLTSEVAEQMSNILEAMSQGQSDRTTEGTALDQEQVKRYKPFLRQNYDGGRKFMEHLQRHLRLIEDELVKSAGNSSLSLLTVHRTLVRLEGMLNLGTCSHVQYAAARADYERAQQRLLVEMTLNGTA